MRWPSWRSCSKSRAASAARSVSTSRFRFSKKTGMRSAMSLGTMTVCWRSVIFGYFARDYRRFGAAGRPDLLKPVMGLGDSMKVARTREEPPEQGAAVEQAPCDQVHDLPIAFDRAFHREQARAEELAALALDEVAPDHDVHGAGLVLEGNENHAARGVRALPAGDQSRHARPAAVRAAAQRLRRHQAEALQARAQQRDRVPAERQAEARVIGDDVFAFA